MNGEAFRDQIRGLRTVALAALLDELWLRWLRARNEGERFDWDSSCMTIMRLEFEEVTARIDWVIHELAVRADAPDLEPAEK